MIRAHLLETETDSFIDAVRGKLDEGVELTVGVESPEPAEFDILISGVPRLDDIKASRRLRVLLIPWAGLPIMTRDLLVGPDGELLFPDISIHNLHYNAASTAEMAVTLMMSAARGIVPLDRALRRNDWSSRYLPPTWPVLESRTALVLGYGSIGKKIGEICDGLGMKVKAIRRRARADEHDRVEVHELRELRALLLTTDALFLSVPHTPETRGMIGREELALLPDGAIVVNIARGPVIDQEALYRALVSRRLRAGLDVWYNYPREKEKREDTPPADFPFHELDNVVMTPHVGGNTADDEYRRAIALADFLNRAARGEEPPNRVDPVRGY